MLSCRLVLHILTDTCGRFRALKACAKDSQPLRQGGLVTQGEVPSGAFREAGGDHGGF